MDLSQSRHSAYQLRVRTSDISRQGDMTFSTSGSESSLESRKHAMTHPGEVVADPVHITNCATDVQ